MSLTVIGATSAIGIETAKVFAFAGHDLLLISRDTNAINCNNFGQETRRPSVTCLDCDVSHSGSIETISKRIIESLDDDPYVLVAAGTIGSEKQCGDKLSNILEIIDVNFRNVAAVVALVSEELEQRRKGCIIVLSSVAGERGRQSNFVYGAAKSGLSIFSQGLRNKLFNKGVHVLTVKLGYVDTPMLRQSLGSDRNNVPSFLIGNPEKVGEEIFQAAIKKKNVVYLGQIWRLIMFFVRNIPESLFKRLHL